MKRGHLQDVIKQRMTILEALVLQQKQFHYDIEMLNICIRSIHS